MSNPVTIENERWLPVLKTVTRHAWSSFKIEWESYTQKGGSQPLVRAISSTVLPVLKLRLRKATYELDGASVKLDLASAQTPDAAIIDAIDALYAPRSRAAALDRYRAISMRKNDSLAEDPVVSYCSQHLLLHESILKETRPAAKAIVRAFVDGLRPALLQEEVRAMAPSSLEEAAEASLDVIESLSRYSGKLVPVVDSPASRKFQGPSTGPPPVERPSNSDRSNKIAGQSTTPNAKRTPFTKPDSAKSSSHRELQCHHCGEFGHIRPNCPNKAPRKAADDSGFSTRPGSTSPRSGGDGAD